MKRGVYGNFHSVSGGPFATLSCPNSISNTTIVPRSATTMQRADALLRGAKGKRLLYRWPD